MISSTGLVYGRIMRRQRAGKTDRENLHNLVEWPPYPSGSGYVVTRCVPLREIFDTVPFATFSRTNKFIGPRYPWCKEGPSAHEADHDCRLKDSHIAALLLRRCIGKSTCTVQATEATFGSTILECARDARGWERPQLLATLRCTSNVTR
jgi:hypothetical protein